MTWKLERKGTAKEKVMNEPTMETLARRLDKVERENRWLKRAGVVALAVIATVVLMGQATESKVAKVVKAEKFVVQDSSGKIRATLATSDGSVGLELYDDEVNEKFRVRLGVEANGETRLVLNAKEEKNGIVLGTAPDGVLLGVHRGKQRVTLGVGFEIGGSLGFTDRNGRIRAGLAVLPDGPSELSFWDKNKKKRAMFSHKSDGLSTIVFTDRDERLRFSMGVWPDGTPGLSLFDRNEKVIWSPP